MNHYYSENPDTPSNEQKKTIVVNETVLNIITDNGVFAKKGLDHGTRTLLESIETDKIKGSVLDFGCGYGPIGLYIKKVSTATVDMIDINNRSLELARKNALLNKLTVNVFNSNKFENITAKYDFIITNPPIRVGKKELYDILSTAKEHLKENGQLWFVIHKDQGAKSTAEYLKAFYDIKTISKDKGFYVFCALKH